MRLVQRPLQHTVYPVRRALILSLAVFAGAPDASAQAIADQRPGDAPSLARRIDEAIEATRSRDFALATALGNERIAAEPSDWRGWYLLALAERERTLEGRDAELARVTDTRRQEEIRLLVRYLASPQAGREAIARAAVVADPNSSIAEALVGSAIAPDGRLREAVARANAALALDPSLVLAARVLASSYPSLGQDEGREAACELLRRFPYDAVVTSFGLLRCPLPGDIGARLDLLTGVLRERRGTPQSRDAMHLLLSGRALEGASAESLGRVIALLDPGDESWWPWSDGILYAFLRADPRAGGAPADRFFESFHLRAGAVRSVNVEMVRLSSLVLSRRFEAMERTAEAITTLERALPVVPKLRRAGHYQALARLFDAVGRDADAASARSSARRLVEPTHAPSASDDSFPILELPGLVAGDGTAKRWIPRGERATIVLYWDVDCVWSRRVAADLIAAHKAGTAPFATHEIDILWLHRRHLDQVKNFESKIRDLGLDTAALVFPSAETDEMLGREFGISGTPWLAVALPDGRVVHEDRGCRTTEWQARVAAWLDARVRS